MCSRAGARGRGREGGRRTHRGSSYLSGDRRGSTVCRRPHANVAGSPRATPRAWGSRSSIGSSGFLLRQVRTFCLRNREKHPGRRCQTAAKRAAVINAFDGERGGKSRNLPSCSSAWGYPANDNAASPERRDNADLAADDRAQAGHQVAAQAPAADDDSETLSERLHGPMPGDVLSLRQSLATAKISAPALASRRLLQIILKA